MNGTVAQFRPDVRRAGSGVGPMILSAGAGLSMLWMPVLLYPAFGLGVIGSFLAVASVLAFMAHRCLVGRAAGIAFASTTVFFVFFFLVAPILQLTENPRQLLNTMPVQSGQIAYANLLAAIFLGIFVVFYLGRSGRSAAAIVSVPDKALGRIFPLLFVLAVIAAAWGVLGIDFGALLRVEGDDDQQLLTVLLKHKVLFMLPFVVFALYASGVRGRTGVIVLLVLFAMVLATKNPFYDRRNSLGPVYLALLVAPWSYFLHRTRRYFVMLAGALLVLFPLTSLLTHHAASSWNEVLNADTLLAELRGHFLDMHYDAWANFVAAIDRVNVEGLRFGRQLAGSALFFVPRAWWPEKPVSSGQLLGEYLGQRYALWFDNISSPLPAEGYLDFGVPGVVLFALGLAWFAKHVDRLVAGGNRLERISGVYFACFLLFVLRGSLLPAVAYGSGAYVAIKLVPALLVRLRAVFVR